MKKIILIFVAFISLQGFAFSQQHVKTFEDYKLELKERNLSYSTTGMVAAISRGDYEVVKLYLNAGMSPNDTYFSFPLTYFALQKKQTDIFRLLLKYGANKEARAMGTTLLFWAISRNNPDAVKILAQYGADMNTPCKGTLPLVYAINQNNPEMVEVLINNGAAINDAVLKEAERSKDDKIINLVL